MGSHFRSLGARPAPKREERRPVERPTEEPDVVKPIVQF